MNEPREVTALLTIVVRRKMSSHLSKFLCILIMLVTLAKFVLNSTWFMFLPALLSGRIPPWAFENKEVRLFLSMTRFCSPAHMPGKFIQQFKMGGVQATNSEVVEESAASEGIRHLETWENLEIEDQHYTELTYLHEDKVMKPKTTI